MANNWICLSGRCLSPIACSVWGYCRERNFDGRPPVTKQESERRLHESNAETQEKADSACDSGA